MDLVLFLATCFMRSTLADHVIAVDTPLADHVIAVDTPLADHVIVVENWLIM